jgi:hypothetical protein
VVAETPRPAAASERATRAVLRREVMVCFLRVAAGGPADRACPDPLSEG